jgi:hypothetical protein
MDVGGLSGGEPAHPDDRRAPPPSAAIVVPDAADASTPAMVHAARAAIVTRFLLNTPVARSQTPILNRMPERMRQFQGIPVTVLLKWRRRKPADGAAALRLSDADLTIERQGGQGVALRVFLTAGPCSSQLFLEVFAKNAEKARATFSLSHCGQRTLANSFSRMLSWRSKLPPQVSHRYSYVGILPLRSKQLFPFHYTPSLLLGERDRTCQSWATRARAYRAR